MTLSDDAKVVGATIAGGFGLLSMTLFLLFGSPGVAIPMAVLVALCGTGTILISWWALSDDPLTDESPTEVAE